jgi:peptidoglycan/LPS O-acetylase OafA/YrhL
MRTEGQPVLIDRTNLSQRGLRGTLVALALFVVVGSVSAVWANPFFTRMTPVGTWELAATAMLAALAGVTSAFWVSRCRMRAPGSGGIVGFLGIACPICNKVLMLIFGGPALLAWFDPVRPVLTVFGILVMGYAAFRSWQAFRNQLIPARVSKVRDSAEEPT